MESFLKEHLIYKEKYNIYNTDYVKNDILARRKFPLYRS